MKDVYARIVRHERPDLVPRAELLNEMIESVFSKVIPKDASIIQYGCACGYLLDTFKAHGYTNLTGVDKDPDMARDWMEGVKFIPSTARWALKDQRPHDVVLIHRFLYLLPDTEQTEEIYRLLVKGFTKYLIIIEEEVGENGDGRPSRYYRNYQPIFESLGLKQTLESSGRVQNVTLRVFTK